MLKVSSNQFGPNQHACSRGASDGTTRVSKQVKRNNFVHQFFREQSYLQPEFFLLWGSDWWAERFYRLSGMNLCYFSVASLRTEWYFTVRFVGWEKFRPVKERLFNCFIMLKGLVKKSVAVWNCLLAMHKVNQRGVCNQWSGIFPLPSLQNLH